MSNRLSKNVSAHLNRSFNHFNIYVLGTKLRMCYVCAYTSHSPPGLDLRTGTTECSEFKSGINIRKVDCAYDCKVMTVSVHLLFYDGHSCIKCFLVYMFLAPVDLGATSINVIYPVSTTSEVALSLSKYKTIK